MILTAEPLETGLRGEVTPPGDKSISHRVLIFASLAAGRSDLRGVLESEDTLATLRACEQLGAKVDRSSDSICISGTGGDLLAPPAAILDMGNSGTAMRLLAGVLSGQAFDSTLSGDESLNRRPMRRIVEPLRLMGAHIQATEPGTAPLRIRASEGLHGISYTSPVASAQIKSCVLLAGLYATGTTCVNEPRLSRDHTERLLPLFGVDLPAPRCVTGGVRLKAVEYAVPGDISSAVFPLATAALIPGSQITVSGVGLNPTRTGFLDCLQEMGAQLRVMQRPGRHAEPVGDIELTFSGPLNGIDVPASRVADMIDEMPLLMVLAAAARGTTRIRGAAELRVKESDRLAVMAAGLRTLGVALQVYPDGMDIIGGPVNGGCVNSAGDHRCAMSFAVLGQVAAAPVQVDGAQYIATSYPGFCDDMNRLGANLQTGVAV